MGMITISATSVAANTVSANLIAGNVNEILQRPSYLRFGLVGSAAGLNCTIQVGNRIIVTDQPISSANRWPIMPDDFHLEAGGMPGEKIFLTLRNTTGGALTCNVVIIVTELG